MMNILSIIIVWKMTNDIVMALTVIMETMVSKVIPMIILITIVTASMILSTGMSIKYNETRKLQ